MSDLANLQQLSALPRARIALCLNSTLAAEQEELERALKAEHARDTNGSPGPELALSQVSRSTKLETRLADVKARAEQATVTFEFTALPRAQFAALETEAPADDDGNYPFEFFCAVISASLTSHSLSIQEVREWLENSLSQGQTDAIILAAMSVNRESGEQQIPFSVSGSAPNPS